MFRLVNGLYIIVILLCISACSEEIEMMEADPIPVVYCLLDPSESFQYVRVGRTFNNYKIDSSFSPDQIHFFEELEVYLVHEKEDGTQDYFQCFLNEDAEREPGLFPMGGLQLYIANCKVEFNQHYSLIIYRDSEREISYARTLTLGGELEVLDPIHVPYRLINLFPGQDYAVRVSKVKNAFIYQTTLSFEFDEMYEGIPTRKTIQMPLKFMTNKYPDQPLVEQKILGEDFLRKVARAIQADSTVTRIPVCLNFHFTCCGEEVLLKVSSEINSNSFSIIDYTNFTNASGLFSTVNHQIVENLPLSKFTIDSLAMHTLTRELNFLSYDQINSR